MDRETEELYSNLLNMCIAAYLNKNPNVQVLKMAKKYKKATKSKQAKKSLSLIIKSSQPSLVVKKTLDYL